MAGRINDRARIRQSISCLHRGIVTYRLRTRRVAVQGITNVPARGFFDRIDLHLRPVETEQGELPGQKSIMLVFLERGIEIRVAVISPTAGSGVIELVIPGPGGVVIDRGRKRLGRAT